jgi:hypothetical protein
MTLTTPGNKFVANHYKHIGRNIIVANENI